MMEVATCASGSRGLNTSSSWIVGTEKFAIGKTNRLLKFSCNNKEDGRTSVVCINSIAGRRSSSSSSSGGGVTAKPSSKSVGFQRSCVYKNAQASTVDQYSDYNSMDDALILKKKSQDIGPYLSGRCIYLVGMMGSGKSTVGKILAEVLGYSFLDSDNLVEQAVGATSVAQIFKQYSEGFFRDNESKVLGELSLMRRLVVATGGGAVIRPINWKYMKKGITVWLDVPLEALARRIAAVGTNSRPLLHNESGDAYTTAYKRLTVLSEERGEVYANADAKVCLQRIAHKLGLGDVSKLSPSAIAIEVLIQIEGFLEDEEDAETLERNF